jgi:hypothetical protein
MVGNYLITDCNHLINLIELNIQYTHIDQNGIEKLMKLKKLFINENFYNNNA